jgi:N-acetylmuramic acid 6-phosphate (MurNAc-6-P) etherase
LRPSNVKLRDRMVRIVRDITGKNYEASERLLEENDFVIRRAVMAAEKEGE